MRLKISGLITDHPIGCAVALVESVACEFFQQWMQILDWRDPFFRFHVFGDEFHRARPIKRDQSDNVIELFYIELLRETRHSAGLHLEETDRFAAIIERERRWIVERNVLQR